MLNENKSVFETIDDVAVGDVRTKIRDILGAFMFRGEDIDKKVKVLSGGERSRLAMIRLLLEPVNLLVLDEPTNHLDMRSKDVLKEALNQFDGTVIVVSHDREFLNGLSSKVYEFTNKKIKEHLGGIYDFLQTKKMDSLKELEVKKAVSVVQADVAPSDNKLNYLERKEMNKKISKMERAVSNSEDNIARFEEQIAQMEELLANPENMQDQSLFSKYEKAKKDLEKEMSDWENLNEELEQLIAEKGE